MKKSKLGNSNKAQTPKPSLSPSLFNSIKTLRPNYNNRIIARNYSNGTKNIEKIKNKKTNNELIPGKFKKNIDKLCHKLAQLQLKNRTKNIIPLINSVENPFKNYCTESYIKKNPVDINKLTISNNKATEKISYNTTRTNFKP